MNINALCIIWLARYYYSHNSPVFSYSRCDPFWTPEHLSDFCLGLVYTQSSTHWVCLVRNHLHNNRPFLVPFTRQWRDMYVILLSYNWEIEHRATSLEYRKFVIESARCSWDFVCTRNSRTCNCQILSCYKSALILTSTPN